VLPAAIACALSVALLIGTVLLRYEALRVISSLIVRREGRPRRKMLTVLFGVMAAHLAEITLYALGYWFADVVIDIGDFKGVRAVGFSDYLYFAAETFTALGMGDLYPVGEMRLIASLEALNGLLLIGWSASFTYLAMARFWHLHRA
jgi:hypothetical protein